LRRASSKRRRWISRTSLRCPSRSASRQSSGHGGCGSVKIDLNRDWTEFLCALISRRVRFVLVGGHAVAGDGERTVWPGIDAAHLRAASLPLLLRAANSQQRSQAV